jgi:hypothetical protein
MRSCSYRIESSVRWSCDWHFFSFLRMQQVRASCSSPCVGVCLKFFSHWKKEIKSFFFKTMRPREYFTALFFSFHSLPSILSLHFMWDGRVSPKSCCMMLTTNIDILFFLLFLQCLSFQQEKLRRAKLSIDSLDLSPVGLLLLQIGTRRKREKQHVVDRRIESNIYSCPWKVSLTRNKQCIA